MGVIAKPEGAPAMDSATAALNDELQDKGFVLTSVEDIIAWARNGSLHWMTFGLACCAIEMMHVAMPRYDAERLRLCAPRIPAPVRRDDRGGHVDQQDWPRPCARFTTRCRNRAM